MRWKTGPGFLIAGGVAWVLWCFLVVLFVVPALLRKLCVWPGTTAYVLCLVPLIAVAAWKISAAAE